MLLALARPEEENKRTNVVGITGAYEIYSFYTGLPKRKIQWSVVARSRLCACHRLYVHSAASDLYHVGDVNFKVSTWIDLSVQEKKVIFRKLRNICLTEIFTKKTSQHLNTVLENGSLYCTYKPSCQKCQ